MNGIDFYQAWTIVKPLSVFVLAMSIYAIFIFKFYRFLARKDIVKVNLRKYNKADHYILNMMFGTIFYFLEYIFLLPIFIFIWFAVLAALLTFLAKNQSLESILLVAIAVVGAVRVTSYYKEDLSKDLAKMLPFALLGVFLVDISFFDISTSFEMMKSVVNHINLLVYYLGFIVVLELALRLIYIISYPFTSEEKSED